MPVSVGPHSDDKTWKRLVVQSQRGWEEVGKLERFKKGVYQVPSLVFSTGSPEDLKEDKSGIVGVNALFKEGEELYPESQKKFKVVGVDSAGKEFERNAAKIQYFEKVYQVETLSVLRTMIEDLSKVKSVKFTPAKITSKRQLLERVGSAKVVCNASGNGMPKIFGVKPIVPIRGDLMVLRIPIDKLSQRDLDSFKQTLWMRRYYLFPRIDAKGKYAEVVLGGTFLKGNSDLSPSNETSKEIISIWHEFLHSSRQLPDLFAPGHTCTGLSSRQYKQSRSSFVSKTMGSIKNKL